ncbi:transcriptional Coactivator p15-domain-containing protein [Rhodotorula diobovata]|uniref:Transcriptional Coactivator p15-domain-containing protein n=1 Tax=Rhodotorula diobovata TaxID=5288 RepID=A0A5C5G8J3_9BASI|nr:transcriptional Coactivator p15-domain-containing protein [Rhodotorula diobovata]
MQKGNIKREAEPDSDSDDKPRKKMVKGESTEASKGESKKKERKKDSASPQPTKDKGKGKDKDKKRKVGDARRATSELQTDDKGDQFVDLGKNKRVVVSDFKGKTLISIREYYNDSGEWKPGKKGIALPVEAWDRLKKSIGAIDGAIDDLVG